MTEQNERPSFTKLTDLAAERLGGQVLFANDEFFAEKENLLKPGRGIFIPDKYTDHGKWMDGWETRRRRTPGHDWCIIRLAVPGKIKGVDIDTNHFLGNHPPFASLEAAHFGSEPKKEDFAKNKFPWKEILPKSPLRQGSQNFFKIENERVWTHLKFNIFPDGGVARFRVFGEVSKDWTKVGKGEIIDLAAAINGARTLLCNDMFFSAMGNLILPGPGKNMGDGWETKRSRVPGNVDWLILKLATKGQIKKILVDTSHFKGNFPDSCSLEGCVCERDDDIQNSEIQWFELLPPMKLQANFKHFFEKEIRSKEAITHVRFKIYPDGGVSRLRLFGIIKR